jgi:parallel beta-helix repeat protein
VVRLNGGELELERCTVRGGRGDDVTGLLRSANDLGVGMERAAQRLRQTLDQGGCAVYGFNGARLRLRECLVDGTSAAPVAMWGPGGLTLADTVLNGSGFATVFAHTDVDLDISDCELRNPYGCGLFAARASAVRVNRTTCTPAASAVGLVALQCAGVRLSGNTVHGGAHCIEIQGTRGEAHLSENICEGAGTNGISLSEAFTGRVVANHCSGNKGCGILAMEEAAPHIEGNECAGNRVGIAFVDHARGTAFGNRCHDNLSVGIWSGEQSAPAIERNTCQDNLVGIRIDRSAKPTLGHNEISGNRRAGIGRVSLVSAYFNKVVVAGWGGVALSTAGGVALNWRAFSTPGAILLFGSLCGAVKLIETFWRTYRSS